MPSHFWVYYLGLSQCGYEYLFPTGLLPDTIYQVGIQSYAPRNCGRGESVFTNIVPYMKWIEENLQPIPIDCVWNDWDTIVGPCIDGYYERFRTKKRDESNGGKCEGSDKEKLRCKWLGTE